MPRLTIWRKIRCAFLALIPGLVLLTPTLAQNAHGSLGGTVRDSSGAAVPAATITARNPGLSLVRESQSDAHGEFRIVALSPGAR